MVGMEAGMTTIDDAISNLEHLRDCFVRTNQAEDVARTLAELAGWYEVRDGIPADPMVYYGYRARYEEARATARAVRDERESQP